MNATIVLNVANNGYLVQYQDNQGGTESQVFRFEDSKQILELIESWMELSHAGDDNTGSR